MKAHRGFESLPLRQSAVQKFYIQLALTALVVGVAFGLVWKLGWLTRLATYFGETRDELKKCNWPSREELWQTTVIVFAITALLGLFTVGSDFVLVRVIRSLLGSPSLFLP